MKNEKSRCTEKVANKIRESYGKIGYKGGKSFKTKAWFRR